MGEKAHLPHENGISKQNENSSDQEMPSDNENEEEFEDMSREEFQVLDGQLDALNAALDNIEQKNDDIHAQLLQLLDSNREIRRQMQDQDSSVPPSAPDSSEPAN